MGFLDFFFHYCMLDAWHRRIFGSKAPLLETTDGQADRRAEEQMCIDEERERIEEERERISQEREDLNNRICDLQEDIDREEGYYQFLKSLDPDKLGPDELEEMKEIEEEREWMEWEKEDLEWEKEELDWEEEDLDWEEEELY